MSAADDLYYDTINARDLREEFEPCHVCGWMFHPQDGECGNCGADVYETETKL